MALNIEQRLGQKLSPREDIIWSYIKSICPNITSLKPLYYQGILAGHNMTLYNANTLYIAYDLMLTSTLGPSPNTPQAELYDYLNVVCNYLRPNNSHYWDATAAGLRIMPNGYVKYEYLVYSRIIVPTALLNYIYFVGYVIIY